MAEPSLEGFSDRISLRRALALRLREVRPELRILAEGFLAEASVIDLLAVDADGGLLSIRFSKPGDDQATLTRALGDLTWLRPRRPDFLKLVPGLGIDPSVEPRALVVCRGFGAESRAAADNFPDDILELWCCRGLSIDGRRQLVTEPVNAGGILVPSPDIPSAPQPFASAPARTTRLAAATELAMPLAAPGTPSSPRPPGPRPLAEPPSPSTFRSGLSDFDLDSRKGSELSPGLDGEDVE